MANVKHPKRSTPKAASPAPVIPQKQPVANKKRPAASAAAKPRQSQPAVVAGWLQDVSLEAPMPASALQLKAGERELEFSVAMRKQGSGAQTLAELRARVLVHARGSVLAMAEASYMAPMAQGVDEAVHVQGMYPPLRQALQTILALAGHTPPLPESLDKAS